LYSNFLNHSRERNFSWFKQSCS